MAKLIVKDRRLCIVNGRLVSDADGAPCVCDGSSPGFPCNEPFPNVCWEIFWNPGNPCLWFSVTVPGLGLYSYIVQDAFFPRPIFILDQFPRSIPDAITFVLQHDPTTLFAGQPSPPQSVTVTLDIEIFALGLSCDENGQWGINRIVLTAVGNNQPTNIPWISSVVTLFGMESFPARPFGSAMSNGIQACQSGGASSNTYAGGTLIVRPVPSCGNNGQVYLARACDDPDDLIPVDFATRPPNGRTCRFEDRIYTPVPSASLLPPVAVQWLPDLCPQASGQFALANKCNPLDPGPATVVYAVNPAVGLGSGAVRWINTFPNPACPIRLCTEIVQYQPTTQIADGPATPGTAHLNGTACGLPYQATCESCPNEPGPDDPIDRPSRPASSGDDMLDAMGFDPAEELRRVQSGGCCGQPST